MTGFLSDPELGWRLVRMQVDALQYAGLAAMIATAVLMVGVAAGVIRLWQATRRTHGQPALRRFG